MRPNGLYDPGAILVSQELNKALWGSRFSKAREMNFFYLFIYLIYLFTF